MDEELYYVVKNGEDQYSVWIKGGCMPPGWDVVGSPASKQECLERIEMLWTDLMPKTVRDHLNQYAVEKLDHAV